MKTNFLRRILPLGVMVLGVAGAFASNASKQIERKSTVVDHAYYYNSALPSGSRCVMVDVECQEGPGEICTDFANRQVWKTNVESLLGCTTYLSKIN